MAAEHDVVYEGKIAAIDFGTSCCSLAYAMEEEKLQMLYHGQLPRVPTVLLIKKSGEKIESVDIGRNAQVQYESLTDEEYTDEHIYFECFKMELRKDEQDISRQMTVAAFEGKNYYLIEVIAILLQYLKRNFEEELKANHPPGIYDERQLKATDFNWAITVPAIWTEKGKQMMQEAAYMAGLVSEVAPIVTLTSVEHGSGSPQVPEVSPANQRKLTLVLEPECAALYCHLISPFMHYMIIDIGGGTVDIAVHNLESADTGIKSILPPTGNAWGGTSVNKQFSALLENIFNDPGFKQFCSEPGSEAKNKAVVTNLVYHSFEVKKRHFGDFSGSQQRSINVRLDYDLIQFYGKDNITKGIQALGDDRVRMKKDILVLDLSKMEELFAPAVEGIIECAMSALDDCPTPVDTVYLVGGFGGCYYLREKIKESIVKKLPHLENHVIIPNEPELAVCKGAVIFQNHPKTYEDLKYRMKDLQQKKRDCQRTIRIYQQLVLSRQEVHWVINEKELTITEEILGKGSFGQVKVGEFRGLRVAIKFLHDLIISEYNLALFSREMDIASRVRHPNLVQFIGATNVGSPLIVTELMSTSLHKELQSGKPLTQLQVISIGQDVALGLNYLHLWKPEAIIHRDVSSPNILLEPSYASDATSFKAKVTDYGTANLYKHTSTKMPGNASYASPESLNPSDHSPSMDVYSYCVLLMEMSLNQLPAMTVEGREKQAQLLCWHAIKSLVQRGLNIKHTERPKMAQILDTLKEIQLH